MAPREARGRSPLAATERAGRSPINRRPGRASEYAPGGMSDSRDLPRFDTRVIPDARRSRHDSGFDLCHVHRVEIPSPRPGCTPSRTRAWSDQGRTSTGSRRSVTCSSGGGCARSPRAGPMQSAGEEGGPSGCEGSPRCPGRSGRASSVCRRARRGWLCHGQASSSQMLRITPLGAPVGQSTTRWV